MAWEKSQEHVMNAIGLVFPLLDDLYLKRIQETGLGLVSWL